MLVASGLAASRTAAQRMIAAGRVNWSGGIVAKAALDLAPETRLTVTADPEDRFVSRGGLKLAGALVASGIDVAGRTCLDVGQSTGGFTDCLLQAGARHVVGLDVGHGQLHPRLLADSRITAIEGINCRSLVAADLGNALPNKGFDLIVGDLSFISLTLVLPQLPPLLAADGDSVAAGQTAVRSRPRQHRQGRYRARSDRSIGKSKASCANVPQPSA